MSAADEGEVVRVVFATAAQETIFKHECEQSYIFQLFEYQCSGKYLWVFDKHANVRREDWEECSSPTKGSARPGVISCELFLKERI